MQVDDCDRSSLEKTPIPESGRFVNPGPANLPENEPHRSLTERVYRFLERVRFVVPVSRERTQRGGKSIKTTSEFSR